MKMTNKIKNNFIQLILENKNNENINDIVNIKINHRKILIKAKELVGINRGINIIKQLLIGNNPGNNSYTEIHFGPKQMIIIANIKNNNYIYFGILISFILILFSFYIIKQLLIGNNNSNNTYDEIHFSPIQILVNTNIRNNQYIYYGILISFILILCTICITKRNNF